MKSTHAFGLAFVLYLFASPLFAREAPDSSGDLFVPAKLQESEIDIRIDGVLDEAVWETLPWQDQMLVIEPDTLAEVPLETRVRLFYTDKGLYVGVWNEQDPQTLISRLSSRDVFINRDDFAITIDPSGEGLYGYWFGVNLGGTLQDGTVLPERQYSNQWDGPFNGASAEHEQGWSAELFIPWSMMSMPDSAEPTRKMGYYISREVAYKNERWAYPAYPRTKPVFLSKLPQMEITGVSPKPQFTFYPYASATYDNVEVGNEDSYKAGFDLFWRPSTNLQLTATVSPDFGNVESDNVVVNLSSFETFFPEKRAFFLEGNEIFVATPRARTNQRGTPTTLLNTRRIGAPPLDPGIPGFEYSSLEANQPTELIGAAKITGQSGKLRYGVLTAFEDDTRIDGEIAGTPYRYLQSGRDYAVARVLYEDTSVGGRRAIGFLSTAAYHPQGDAIVHGVDAHYLTPDGAWNIDAQVMHSDVADETGNGGFVDFVYTPSKGYRHELALDYYDKHLQINDLGFLRRNDSHGFRYSFERNTSNDPRYKSVTTRVQTVQNFNSDGRLVRSGFFAFRDRQLKNNHWFFTEFNYFPQRWDDINSDGNGAYKVDERFELGTFYTTDESRKVQVGFDAFVYSEDLGAISNNASAELTWRPTDRFSVKFNLGYENKDGWLLHWDGPELGTYKAEFWRPKLETDFFITARQQFRITAQWAGLKAFEQERYTVPVGDGELQPIPKTSGRDFTISRLTFQARYRWEIAPLSDLFVVYTRGSNVDSNPDADFGDLMHDSWTQPLVDIFVIKLRYRLGN